MNTHISIHQSHRRHQRDVALLDRLFSDWSRGRGQRNADAHDRLDAIEAQLARLEGSVTMTESSRRPALAGPRRIWASRSALSHAVQQS